MTDLPGMPLPAEDLAAIAAVIGATDAEDLASYFHPLANLFPLMPDEENDALGESMEMYGQRDKVVLLDGLLLDGRNRAIQARKRGLTLHLRHYNPATDGPDPVAFVLDKNLRRRQLSESQRAMVAARLATFGWGGSRGEVQAANLPLENLPPAAAAVSQEEAARLLNVSERTVRTAKAVQDDGSQELQKAVEQGEVAVSAAGEVASLPKAAQTELLMALPRDQQGHLTPEAKKEISRLAKEIRDQRTASKKERRATRERELGDKIAELPAERFGFIGSDPEWKFKPFSEETGMDRAPENHYPTSPDAAIAARRVQDIAADDCVHAMWTTDLARGIDTMREQGFTFRSYFVWLKNLEELVLSPEQRAAASLSDGRVFVEKGAPGLGYWNRDKDEILLIGTRGSPICPAMGEQGDSTWFELKREHSVKPEVFYVWANKHFANTPRIELNARRRRPGWQAWGNEVEPGDPAMIARERQGLIRGLIDAHDMVQLADGRSVAFNFVTAQEWDALLATSEALSTAPIEGACCARDASDTAPRGGGAEHADVPPQISEDDQLEIPPFLRRKA